MLSTAIWIRSDRDATEGSATPGRFMVERSGDLTQTVTFNLSYGGTASSSDYSPPPSTVTLPANASSQAVDIQPVDDTSDEATETITATLSTTSMPAGYAISMSSATINLLDNDEAIVPTISVVASDGSASEQVNPSTGLPDPGVFTFTRDGDLTNPLTVYYDLPQAPLGVGVATHGVDYNQLYTGASGSATFAASASQTTVTIQPKDDALVEGTEMVDLRLLGSPSMNYKISQTAGTAYLTLNDNELGITVDLQVRASVDPTEEDPGEFLAWNENADPAGAPTLSNPTDPEIVPGRLTITHANPAIVFGDLAWSLPAGVRVWWNRNGEWVPVENTANYPSSNWEPLLVEGLSPASGPIVATYDPGPANMLTGADKVKVTVLKIDLDIDSDNNNEEAAPGRTPYEEEHEEEATRSKITRTRVSADSVSSTQSVGLGKRLYVTNNEDQDLFTPLVIEVAPGVVAAGLKVQLDYNPGELTIWRKTAGVGGAPDTWGELPPLTPFTLQGGLATETLYVQAQRAFAPTFFESGTIKVAIIGAPPGTPAALTADTVAVVSAGYTATHRRSLADPTPRDKVVTGQGGMLLGGGATDHLVEAHQWFMKRTGGELTGGGDVVLLNATSSDQLAGVPDRGFADWMWFQMGGKAIVSSVEAFIFDGEFVDGTDVPAAIGSVVVDEHLAGGREAARSRQLARRVNKAEGVYLTGGDQGKYIRVWDDTRVQTELANLDINTRLIGGTSAGMHVLGGAAVILDNPEGVGWEEAPRKVVEDPRLLQMTPDRLLARADDDAYPQSFLEKPFLGDVLTDTHFAGRKRMPRTMAALARLGATPSSAIKSLAANDASIVLIEPSGTTRVVGEALAAAYFISAMPGTSGATGWTFGEMLEFDSGKVVKVPASPTIADATTFTFSSIWNLSLTDPGAGLEFFVFEVWARDGQTLDQRLGTIARYA